MERQANSTEQTVSEGGVTVEQRYTEAEFDLPSVVLTLTADRDEAVAVRVGVPDIESERVGLHPDYRSDGWAITREQLVFEAVVEPDGEVTTLYALDTDDQTVFERAMGSLRIEQVSAAVDGHGFPDPDRDELVDEAVVTGGEEASEHPEVATDEVAAGNDGEQSQTSEQSAGTTPHDESVVDQTTTEASTVDGSRAEAVSSDSSTEGSTADGSTTEGSPTSDSPVEEPSTDDRMVEDRTAEESSVEEPPADSGAGGDTGRLADQSTETLVEELLGRLEDDDIPETHRARLAERVAGGHGGADRERLTSLQARVSDIEAFTGPIERMLDQHGPPAAALDAFEARLAAVENVDERVSELEERIERLDDHDERIERLDERVDDHDEQMTTLGNDLDAATGQLEDDLTSIEAEMEGVQEQLSSVEAAVESARAEASAAGEQAEEVETDLADIEEQLGGLEARVDDLADDWDGMADDIEALQEWRSTLASTFDVFEN